MGANFESRYHIVLSVRSCSLFMNFSKLFSIDILGYFNLVQPQELRVNISLTTC